MTNHTNLLRALVILLFISTFTLVGWAAPIIYATNAPADAIIEVHNFEASDTTTESDQHYVCFDRTVYSGSSAQVFTDLYLLDKDGNRVIVNSDVSETYFQQGQYSVTRSISLPSNLKAGEYKYVLVAKMDMANGQVTRDFEFTSNMFTVSNGEKQQLGNISQC